MGQGHIGDACIEHLHERRQRNRNRDDPRVAFGPPDFLSRTNGYGITHRTLESASMKQSWAPVPPLWISVLPRLKETSSTATLVNSMPRPCSPAGSAMRLL